LTIPRRGLVAYNRALLPTSCRQTARCNMTRARFNATVLNINPDPSIRAERTEVLKAAGFDVREAATGAEGLLAARTEVVDVVLLTSLLPDMDGLELRRRMSEDPAMASLMVIATSKHCNAADRVRALETGTALLPDPPDSDLLIATINVLVKFRWSMEQLSARVDELEEELHILRLSNQSPSFQDTKVR